MLVASIFMLSRFGETFLTLHAYDNFGLQSEYAPTIMLIFNAGWCLSSYPVGVLADRMNRYWFLAMGIVFLILADHFLATANRSEEHTSELQSLMRISSAVFCLKKKTIPTPPQS